MDRHRSCRNDMPPGIVECYRGDTIHTTHAAPSPPTINGSQSSPAGIILALQLGLVMFPEPLHLQYFDFVIWLWLHSASYLSCIAFLASAHSRPAGCLLMSFSHFEGTATVSAAGSVGGAVTLSNSGVYIFLLLTYNLQFPFRKL